MGKGKGEERKLGVNEVFHLNPPFYSFEIEKKRGKKMALEKSTKLYAHFHFSTFNSKAIIVIYSIFFNFSIISTKYIWCKTNYFSSPIFQPNRVLDL